MALKVLIMASPADPVAAATAAAPGAASAVVPARPNTAAVNGWISGDTAALKSNVLDRNDNASASVRPAGFTGTIAAVPTVAATRPATRYERTDTVIRISPLVLAFAAGVHNHCTFRAARRYISALRRTPDDVSTGGTTVRAMSVADGARRSR